MRKKSVLSCETATRGKRRVTGPANSKNNMYGARLLYGCAQIRKIHRRLRGHLIVATGYRWCVTANRDREADDGVFDSQWEGEDVCEWRDGVRAHLQMGL